jgi:hypothetical protein
MDHNLNVIVEFESDDLEQVAAEIRSDGEHSGGIAIGIKAGHDHTVGDGVLDGKVVHSVLPCGAVDLHVRIVLHNMMPFKVGAGFCSWPS